MRSPALHSFNKAHGIVLVFVTVCELHARNNVNVHGTFQYPITYISRACVGAWS